jgi:anti-sigma-K factor RskA
LGRELTPDDLRGLLGAYALGALEPDEQARVEALLLSDQEARAELHALQLGAAWLARSDLRPSEGVWTRIRAEVDADTDASGSGRDEDVDPPVSLDARRNRRRAVAGVAAVAAAVALGIVGVAVVQDTNGGDGTSVEAAARAAARDPGARRVELRTPEGRVAAQLAVYADGRGYVVDAKLPELDARQTYQLWAIPSSGAVSAAVLGRSPSVAVLHGGAAGRASKYAITIERRGGSPTPAGAFVASSGAAQA